MLGPPPPAPVVRQNEAFGGVENVHHRVHHGMWAVLQGPSSRLISAKEDVYAQASCGVDRRPRGRVPFGLLLRQLLQRRVQLWMERAGVRMRSGVSAVRPAALLVIAS